MASKIDKIYAHDDQIGPFARMEISEQKITINLNGQICEVDYLTTSWKSGSDPSKYLVAVPQYVIVPVYHKIRIPFGIVQDIIILLDSYLAIFIDNNILDVSGRFTWDIFFSTLNDYKRDKITENRLSGKSRREILSRGLPRFLWVACAILNGEKVFELLFDATDIEQGKLFLTGVAYDEIIPSLIGLMFKPIDLGLLAKDNVQLSEILNWFSSCCY